MLKHILFPLGTGLFIFLAGMKVMELALGKMAGPYLKNLLQRFTKTPLHGMLAGTGLTALVQSSSAVTVITIGLVNAGVIRFPQTLGVILGTNIGTVVTTELIGLNITKIAQPLLLAAAPLWLVSWLVPERRSKLTGIASFLLKIRYPALAVCGFACVLMGVEIMQSIVPELKSRGLFAWFVEQSRHSLLWGIIAGTVLTAIIQSSAATISMTMGLASVQAIDVDLGIAITIGANIGTCGTALIASAGGGKYGRLVAWAHVLLNAGGAVLFYPLIPLLRDLCALWGGGYASQIAHAQTLFNVICSLVALPLCYLRVFRYW